MELNNYMSVKIIKFNVFALLLFSMVVAQMMIIVINLIDTLDSISYVIYILNYSCGF